MLKIWGGIMRSLMESIRFGSNHFLGLMLFLFLLVQQMFASNSEQLTEQGWEALKRNNFLEAQALFKDALAVDASNNWANYSLTFLYNVHQLKG